jgi:uncharacterized protein
MADKIALITGATSGIGAAFAEKFASQNYDLIITGRREEKIKALASELVSKYNINVEVIISELSNSHTINALVKKIQDTKNLEVLINNAGYVKPRSKFNDQDITAHDNMLTAHCQATMKFVYAALPNMISNKKGIIINVSSIMGFYPFCMQPMYTATKAFIDIFTESLNLELKETGVKAQVLCPGVTYSDFHKNIGVNEDKKARTSSFLWQSPMKPKVVVETSLKYLERNKVICIPGLRNKIITMLHSLKRFF